MKNLIATVIMMATERKISASGIKRANFVFERDLLDWGCEGMSQRRPVHSSVHSHPGCLVCKYSVRNYPTNDQEPQ